MLDAQLNEDDAGPRVLPPPGLTVTLSLPEWELVLRQTAEGSIARFGPLFNSIREQLMRQLSQP